MVATTCEGVGAGVGGVVGVNQCDNFTIDNKQTKTSICSGLDGDYDSYGSYKTYKKGEAVMKEHARSQLARKQRINPEQKYYRMSETK